jgi:tRNA C32,U32 (ribose-2'-O)-methylase TrmJ
MNLGQAVAVTCYELSGLVRAQPPTGRRRAPAASTVEIDRVAGEISRLLTSKKGRHWGGAAQLRAIRQSLTDARLTKGAMFALKTLLKGNEK